MRRASLTRGAFAAAALTMVVAAPVEAAILTITSKGQIVNGYDQAGIFIPAGGDLTGLAIKIVFSFDTTIWRSASTAPDAASGGAAWGTVLPSLGAVVTINGVSQSIGSVYVAGGSASFDNANPHFQSFSEVYDSNGGNYSLWVVNDMTINGGTLPSSDKPISFDVSITDVSFTTTPGVTLTGGSSSGTDTGSFPGSTPGMASGVPEPSTWALMLTGLAAVGLAARRRRKAEAATA